MKSITAIMVAMMVFGGVSCFAGNIRIGDTAAGRIAKDTSIPGKGKPGECLPFALALQKKLQAAGVPARVIVYGYEQGGMAGVTSGGDLYAQPAGLAADRGSHAVVVYEDAGRTYVMDNQSWTPQWVHNASPMHMAQQFSGINCSVRMARVIDYGGVSTPRTPTMTRSPRRIAAN